MKVFKYYVSYEVYKKGKVVGKGAMETYTKKEELGVKEVEMLADSLISRHPGAEDIKVTDFVLLGEVEGEREDEGV